jgi:hypothetical protein
MSSPLIVSLLPLVGSAGGDDADILASFHEGDMVQTASQWTEQMEAPFPIISPCVFLNKALRVGKAWEDIREVDAVLAHIALPLRFIPFKPQGSLYVQSACTIKYFRKLGSRRMACKLTSEFLLYQLLTQSLSGFDHKREALGPPLLDARLHARRSDKDLYRMAPGEPYIIFGKVPDNITVSS